MSRPLAAPVVFVIGTAVLCLFARGPVALGAQPRGMFLGSAEDPAIAYSTAPLSNAASDVNARLRDGRAQLTFDGRSGYLKSALAALDIAIDSQVLVFSKTSFQRRHISDTNPRALFFNDRVALG